MFQTNPIQLSLSALFATVRDQLLDKGVEVPGMPAQTQARNVRYYTFIGLMDRPLGYLGGSPVFGTRHVAQLMAIRALQTRRVTLARIQDILYGLNPVELRRIVDLAAGPPAKRKTPSRDGLPKARLALLAEDRGTCMGWLRIYAVPGLLTGLGILPHPSRN